MISQAEENYLKAIFKIAEKENRAVSTNAIAVLMQTTPASVSDMLRRLSDKNLIAYEKYRGVQLTEAGKQVATELIRRHRLWEVFLVEKLGFSWDEVHDLAEQLEHVQGPSLIERLDAFLDYPRYDPHGDPIPDADGLWVFRAQILLSDLKTGQRGVITGVQEHSSAFLQYLAQMGLTLGAVLELLERIDYDQSVRVRMYDTRELMLSEKVCKNLFLMIENA
ncbi:MAG: metal-dependent transcriptional regulator [Bacteroidetes bacterium]|nr:metal-dependent transcriptional regulator [Bacteroidota bacterium]